MNLIKKISLFAIKTNAKICLSNMENSLPLTDLRATRYPKQFNQATFEAGFTSYKELEKKYENLSGSKFPEDISKNYKQLMKTYHWKLK